MASAETSDSDEQTHALYVEHYLDCVENLPGDLQILLSRILELDSCFQKYIRQLDEQSEVLRRDNIDAAARERAFTGMRRSLAQMHDIGDDKLQLMQSIHETIERRARQLDIDFKNLRPKIEQENNEPVKATTPKETSSAVSQSNKNSTPVNTEKITRRGRRARAEVVNDPPDSSVLSENQSSNLPSTSNGNQKKSNACNNTGKKKKRKVTEKVQQNQREDEDLSDDDEPLYCLCQQVSYGKMICCDNDSCAIEWFHFDCVSLTTKPKGKWYCPQCRGSKPNIMKSKAQFR